MAVAERQQLSSRVPANGSDVALVAPPGVVWARLQVLALAGGRVPHVRPGVHPHSNGVRLAPVHQTAD